MLSAALHLLVVIITAKILGAEGKGITSLITTSILIIILFNDIIGGTALVYLIPRFPIAQLLIPSYVWALITAILLGAIFSVSGALPPEYAVHLVILSLLHSLSSIHLTALVGLEKISANNRFFLLKIGVQLAVLVVFFFVQHQQDVMAFVWSLYAANGIVLTLSILPVWRKAGAWSMTGISRVLNQLVRFGTVAQSANIIQFLNYRFSFYLLNFYFHPGAVGVYSISLAIAEIIWLLSKSIALVQYARIANTEDPAYAVQITLKLVKLSLVSTIIFLIPALLMPATFYQWVFGSEFGEARIALLAMAIGIGFWGITTILAGYFAGRGKYHVNTLGSAIGFVVTLLAGVILIPKYSWTGAGITASLSYISTTLFTLWQFKKTTGKGIKDLTPAKADWKEWKGLMKDKMKR